MEVPNTPWLLVAKIDEDEAFETIHQLTRLGLLTVLGIMLASGLGLLFWWQRFSAAQKIQAQTEADLRQSNAQAEQLAAVAFQARTLAEQANKAKSQFLSNMSHELRTPMHAILSFSNLGLTRAGGEAEPLPKLRGYYENISKSGERLLLLINDLLDLSKLEAGKMVFQMQAQDIRSLALEAIEELSVLAARNHIRMDTEGLAAGLTAECDGMKIGQVIRNLLSNAIKFSPRESNIHLRTQTATLPGRRAGDPLLPGIAFDVIDAGIGIPEDELEAVFDEFIQSSHTRSGGGGTGLGLAICRRIIKGHNGVIHAARNADGPGSHFTFMIPLQQITKP